MIRPGSIRVVVSFRGTQGAESISNWITNLNAGSKLVRCPKDSCDDDDSWWEKTKDLFGKAHAFKHVGDADGGLAEVERLRGQKRDRDR